MKQLTICVPLAWLIIACFANRLAGAETADTLPAIAENAPLDNFDEMWKGFDPRAEPLEVETLREWEEDGVVLRIVRFRIGVFKGKKATLAAVYGFPKRVLGSGDKLPGLVQIHGGGQYADSTLKQHRGNSEPPRVVGKAWQGEAPRFRDFRWSIGLTKR